MTKFSSAMNDDHVCFLAAGLFAIGLLTLFAAVDWLRKNRRCLE